MKIENIIKDNIAETLYITVAMKCKETKRKSPFYNDPFACEIMKKIDYDFAKYRKAVKSSVGVAIRSNYFDEQTRNFIENTKNPVIVNIGCGLDTRFLRLGKQIMDKAIVYELDLPEVIEMRKKVIPEAKNNFYLSCSMFETKWMDLIKEKHPKSSFLFNAEGVLMYFEMQQIKNLLTNLAQRFNKSKILFDVLNSWMCKNSHRHDTVKLTKATFKLSCDNDYEFEKCHEKLKLISCKKFHDFKDLKRIGILMNLLMRIVPALKNSCRILFYNIDDKHIV